MGTPQAICMVRDAEGIRPLMPDERRRVTGFFLFGEGFGDMICLLPTVQKTAEQLAKRLDVWTRRPEVFANHSLLNPIRSDDMSSERIGLSREWFANTSGRRVQTSRRLANCSAVFCTVGKRQIMSPKPSPKRKKPVTRLRSSGISGRIPSASRTMQIA